MSSVRAVSDTEYSEGDDNSGRGLSAREEGLTTSVGDPGSADPGSGSAYFYRDSDPQRIRNNLSCRSDMRILNIPSKYELKSTILFNIYELWTMYVGKIYIY